MSNPLHEIDKLFRDGIEARSEYPPKSLWDNIESELERKTAIKYKKKYRSLKIKATAIIILFLGIVAYQETKLQLDRGTGQQSRALVPSTEPNQMTVEIPPATSLQNKNLEKTLQNKDLEKDIQFDIAEAEDNEIFPELQLREFITSMPDIKFKELHINGERGQTMIAEGIDLSTPALQLKNQSEDNTVFTNSRGESTDITDGKSTDITDIKDRQNHERGLLSPALSFSKIVDDDSWKKDIAAGLKPAISGNAGAKKPNYADGDNSRYSFSVYAAPNIAWATLKEDMYQRPVGPGGSGGSGSGGNISGGNNGGGNNIGGGNNGGNNGGGNNGGNNGGGNNGGGSTSGGASNNSGGIGGRGDDLNEIKQGESENIGYSVGIKLGYNFSKRISLQTGLSYMVNSINVMPKLIFAGKDKNGDVGYRINSSSGYSYLRPAGASNIKEGDSTIVSDTWNKVSYLGIPVVIDYKLLTSGRFSLSAFGGGQVNFLLNGKTTTVFGKGSANETAALSNTEGLRTAYFSAIAGLNAEMRIKNNLALTLAPTGQFGLTHMNKGTSVKTRPNYLGLAAGVKFKF